MPIFWGLAAIVGDSRRMEGWTGQGARGRGEEEGSRKLGERVRVVLKGGGDKREPDG